MELDAWLLVLYPMIVGINNKDEWEGVLEKCTEKTFLSSWEWGEFWVGQGNEIKRLGVGDKSGLKVIVLAVKIEARRGTHILIQHGPNIISAAESEKTKILKELFFELANWGKNEGALFIRCAPLWEKNIENERLRTDLSDMGFAFLDASMHANAYEATWKLDITPSEDELLKAMRKTTRYLIRQTQKNPDIEIEISDKLEDIEIYQKLNEAVAKRQNFSAFGRDYIKREFEIFAKNGQARWFIGKYKNQPVCAALIIFWQGIAFYHQAASLGEFAKYSIPYLLQWEAIKEAKKRQCEIYDFWGYTNPKTNPKHPWAGPTLFKMGFGGQKHEYIKTMDLPLSWRYWPTRLFEKARRLKRGL